MYHSQLNRAERKLTAVKREAPAYAKASCRQARRKKQVDSLACFLKFSKFLSYHLSHDILKWTSILLDVVP